MNYEYNEKAFSEENTLTNKKKNLIKIKNKRNSSFELLRIILITLIVYHHIYI